MAGFIYYKEDAITYNNRQFSSTMSFVTEVAEKMAKDDEVEYVTKMKEITVTNYFPGLCLDIEEDMPTIEEKKFWAIMFYETAREIFERKIGIHDYYFWQTQRICQIYGTGDLITKVIRKIEPRWIPNIRDFREFDKWVKKK